MNFIDQKDFFNDLNGILDNTIEGILLIHNGFIVNVNASLVEILEYDNKVSLIGNLATGVLIPSTNKKYTHYNHDIYQEVNLLTKNATLIPSIIKIDDITYKNFKFKMVSILDLTEFKEKDSFLLKQSRLAAMGEMISMIAHQWRQPLSAIGAVISNLKLKVAMKKYDEKTFDNKLNEINNYLQYMSKTIDDFRNFFKEDKTKEFVDINNLIDSAIELVSSSLTFSKIDFYLELEKLSKIYILQNELIQVILNIINNSKDAFDEKEIENKFIKIITYEDKDFQYITIEDNAGGIPKNIIDKIFEPYFSTKTNKNGTGLGLYMSKTIIEEHLNGTISVKNIENGVIFTIKIKR